MINKRISVFFFLFILAVFCLGSLGLSSENSGQPAQKDIFADVRSKMADAVNKSRVPSLSVAVARDGEIIWEESFGWANIEKKIEATPHTLYSLASISKPITATGLMVLSERGLVDLDRPANEYLGDAQLKAFAGDVSHATVRRLLHHTAGLAIHWNFFYEGDAYKRPEMEESIRRYGILVVPPGVLFNYANFGFGILEYIIEQVSGTTYRDFMKKEIFQPLSSNNMDIFTSPDEAAQDNVAQRYLGKRVIPFYDFDHRGASAVYSSAHDLVRFGMFHLKNHLKDQDAILKDKTITQMQEDKDPNLPEINYKLGWGTGERFGYKFVSHGGGMPGVSTTLDILPEENIAVVVLCNSANRNLSSYVNDIIGAMILEFAERRSRAKNQPQQKPEKVKVPQELVGLWKGEIYTHSGEVPVEIEFNEDGKVKSRLTGEDYADMKPLGPVGRFSFRKDGFNGSFRIPFPTEDGSRERHSLLIDLMLIDKALVGVASAVASNTRFRLPSYIKLTKKLTQPNQEEKPEKTSETDPRIIEMSARKMAVVYTKGDPNVVGQQVMPALYGSVFGLSAELAKKGIKFQMQAPRARWPNVASAPRDEWIGLWGLPIPDEIESIPQTSKDIEVKVEIWEYGTVAQILHIGPFETEPATIETLKKFISEMGYEIKGVHEEEYLTMPGADVQKTLIRYPVRKK